VKSRQQRTKAAGRKQAMAGRSRSNIGIAPKIAAALYRRRGRGSGDESIEQRVRSGEKSIAGGIAAQIRRRRKRRLVLARRRRCVSSAWRQAIVAAAGWAKTAAAFSAARSGGNERPQRQNENGSKSGWRGVTVQPEKHRKMKTR